MTLKHTLGPWETFGPMRFTVYGGDPKVRIAVVDYCTGADSAEHDANARLISAAPDLLAALQYVTDMLSSSVAPDDYEPFRRCMSQARAAISKATGE
jgi:hypothetical protein